MDDLTEKLARYATDFRGGSLDAATSSRIVDHLVDFFGCAIAGAAEETCRITRELAGETPMAKGGASAIGLAVTTTPEQAAFVNSTAGRCLDFNDTFNGTRTGGHPSDMAPAILAAAEMAGLSGRAVVDGTFLAYEVFGALADEVALRDHATDQGAFLSIACAAAISNMLGLGFEKTAHAISLAITTTMPLRVARAGVLSQWKGCATAHSVANAVFTTRLAARGMEGPGAPFRGPDGFLARIPVDMTLAHLGQLVEGRTVIGRTALKFLPVEWGAQASVELFITLAKRIRPEQIASIQCAGNAFLVREIGGGYGDADAKWNPQTRETADHSLPYLLAVALQDGEVTLDSFRMERVLDPKLRPLMQKLTVSELAETKTMLPPRQPVAYKITLTTGEVIEERCEYPTGHPFNPADAGAVDAKFRRIAGPMLGNNTDATLALLHDLASLPKLDNLSAALRGAKA